MMTGDELLFFHTWPQLMPLYEALRTQLKNIYPDLSVKVSKTRISFYNRHMFAMASLPARRRKDWPKEYLMVSFGLNHQVTSPRIAMRTEAYHNRWTHHVLLSDTSQLDEELHAWIAEAYAFAVSKR